MRESDLLLMYLVAFDVPNFIMPVPATLAGPAAVVAAAAAAAR